MGVGAVRFSRKKRYEGVMFNVISVTRGWVVGLERIHQVTNTICIANTFAKLGNGLSVLVYACTMYSAQKFHFANLVYYRYCLFDIKV